MISFTQQQSMFSTLSQNSTSDNLTLAAQLANIEHRYLLQKYFSNETSFTSQTIGNQNLTVTAPILSGATSATLSTAWPYLTNTTYITFDNTNEDVRLVTLNYNSTAISWSTALTGNASTAIQVQGLQFYKMPPNYSKLKTLTITQGNLKWTPTEILTREEWDLLNVFPYYSDIPNNYFIYPGGDHGAQIGIYPIPSTTGNTITFNYKSRIPDLSLADYATGTVSVTNGSMTITGSGTTFVPTSNIGNESRWIQISQPKGDNLWYQVASVDSATQITLYSPYQGITVSGGSYTLGQMPILMEDFHDMLVWKPLVYYYTSIVDNKGKRDQYQELYDEKLKMLNDYAGSKTINVNLGRGAVRMNPNLFPYNLEG